MRRKSRSGRANRVGRSGSGRILRIETLEPRNLLAGIDMSDREQFVLELINRARQAPAVEAARLGVGLNAGLPAGTITSAPKPPLAPNQMLIGTAVAHSQDMLNRNFFDHINPSGQSAGDRIRAAGYPWIAYAENIAWGTSMGANGFHEILFRSAGHRKNILKENVREIGIGLRNGNVLKGTEDFGNRWDDPFITGVAFSDDVVKNDFYTMGEGSAGLIVTATADAGQTVFTTVTGRSGGYSLQVPPGTYIVTATRGDQTVLGVVNGVAIGEWNSKVDFVIGDFTPPVAPEAHGDRTMTEVGQRAVIDVLANDTGDRQQVIVTVNPAHGQAAVATTGKIAYTPQASFAGFDRLEYRVRGSTGLLSNTVVVQIAVIDLQESPWTNPSLEFDVNASGDATPADALILVNNLNTKGARILPAPSPSGSYPQPYLDVSGDGQVSPVDILYIVDCLNEEVRGEGEGGLPKADEVLSAQRGIPLPSGTQLHADVAWPGTWAIQDPIAFSTSASVLLGFETSSGGDSIATRDEGRPQPNNLRKQSLRLKERLDATDSHFAEMGRLTAGEIDPDELDRV